MIEQEFSALILAAGKSVRMGQPKYSLAMSGGITFLEHIVNQYLAFGCRQIVIVMNEEGADNYNKHLVNIFPDNVVLATNHHPGLERFYSVQCGIGKLAVGKSLFLHNVDNPYVISEILNKLIDSHHAGSYCKPVYKGKGGHPVLISSGIVEAIRNEKDHRIILKDFLKGFECNVVVVEDEKVLVNLNTMEDYNAFIEGIGR